MVNYYSQHGEDYILSEIFKDHKDGFFVEVGCIDGKRFSNTLTFEERGWRGLCIEAHAGYIELLRKNRPRSIICHCAVGEKDEENIPFYANSRGSLSTLDNSKESFFREQFGKYFTGFEEQRVPKRTLTTLFREFGVSTIDILSLDIEGYEIEALTGLDLRKYRPKVFLIESDSVEQEKKIDEILLSRGYVKSLHVGENILYLTDKNLEKEIKGKNVAVELVHTAHPLDNNGNTRVEVQIDTGAPDSAQGGKPMKNNWLTGFLSYLKSIIMNRKYIPSEGVSGTYQRSYELIEVGFHGDLYLLELVRTIASSCKYFVETGANVGSTLAHVGRTYPDLKCLSCEPDAEAFTHTLMNTKGLQNVTVVNETSQDFLQRIENDYQTIFQETALFWLDAHGYGFQWPLKEEIAFITRRFKSAYILIDDFKVPGLDCFGYDVYEDQECSFEFIKNNLNPRLHYTVYYPDYTERTSVHHPLRGWVLIEFGHQKKLKLPYALIAKVREVKSSQESGETNLSLPASKSEIVQRSLTCKGWTDLPTLFTLCDLAKKTECLNGDILEIGSAWGRSTVLLGLASHKTIWSIDPHTGGLAYIQKGEQQNSYDEFMQNLNTFDLHGKVKVLRNTTQEVMSQNLMSPDARFSLVFIDGLHTPEGVKIDIDFAYERLVSGGVMVFDDYFELSVKDYATMIDTMLAEKKVNPIRDRDSKLVYFYKSGN